MPQWTVILSTRGEVAVTIEAEDEDDAAMAALARASELSTYVEWDSDDWTVESVDPDDDE